MKEYLSSLTANDVVAIIGYLIAALTAIVSFYRSYKAGKSASEALLIVINALKDEEKMVDGAFSKQTLQKIEDFATTIQADDKAVKQAKQALQGRELDVKIGSFKGKPIFLSDALKLGGLVSAVRKAVRK
ncbi:MAG: hypothetical protein PHW65_04600 [Dehalococcoidales bacterium]|nr:hypothetical protein [Dehalococcoidales bacterium]